MPDIGDRDQEYKRFTLIVAVFTLYFDVFGGRDDNFLHALHTLSD